MRVVPCMPCGLPLSGFLDAMDALTLRPTVAHVACGLVHGLVDLVPHPPPPHRPASSPRAGANAMTQSLVRGERVCLSKVDAFADGVAIKLPGAEPFRLCRELLDGAMGQLRAAVRAGRSARRGRWTQ